MSEKDIESLMRIAYHETKDFSPTNASLYPLYLGSELGRFGVGLKNAALYLGKNLTVRSKKQGGKVWKIVLDEVTLWLLVAKCI